MHRITRKPNAWTRGLLLLLLLLALIHIIIALQQLQMQCAMLLNGFERLQLTVGLLIFSLIATAKCRSCTVERNERLVNHER